MTRYQKRPEEVDAFQITVMNRDQYDLWPDWLRGHLVGDPKEGYLLWQDDREEFAINVNPEDWIVRREDGELDVYQPDVFAKLYVSEVDDLVEQGMARSQALALVRQSRAELEPCAREVWKALAEWTTKMLMEGRINIHMASVQSTEDGFSMRIAGDLPEAVSSRWGGRDE